MKLPWRKRHRCPPCVSLRILINGDLIVGPITGEELAYIARFGSRDEGVIDLMESTLYGGHIYQLEVLAEYVR